MPRTPRDSLASHNKAGDADITIGQRNELVYGEDIRGKMDDVLTLDDLGRGSSSSSEVQEELLDKFLDNPGIVDDVEVSEVFSIINNSYVQDVPIIPYIEDALTRATQGVGLDEWLVRLLIPTYKAGKLSAGLRQKVTEAIRLQPLLYSDLQPLLYSDLQLTQGGRRRYKSKRHKRTSKKHKRTYKKYKRTSKKHK